MSVADSIARPVRTKAIATWILKSLLALAFLAAAGAKLAGVPMMVEVFNQIGFGQWFRIVTALVELTGVLALFIPGFTAIAALWLAATMAGAFLAHIFLLHTNPAGAIILLVLNLAVVWLNRDELSALRAKFL